MIAALAEAYHVAALAHAGQTRKGTAGAAYVNHVIEVARLVAEVRPDDPEAVMAAALHDVVEDSDATLGDLRARFGDRVAALVDALTDDPETDAAPTPEKKRRQAEKMAGAEVAARTVKIADQTSNLRDVLKIGDEWSATRKAEYLHGARLVVDACRGSAPSLEALFDDAAAALDAHLKEAT